MSLFDTLYHHLLRLIIPMWNWNYEFNEYGLHLFCGINHTNVELKYGKIQKKIRRFREINHTNVELKFSLIPFYFFICIKINHTNVELKCYLKISFIISCFRLIIPMWNWNLAPRITYQFSSKINHTNVELKFETQHDAAEPLGFH